MNKTCLTMVFLLCQKGQCNVKNGHYRINGQRDHLADAPFILLLRFVQGCLIVKDRWVFAKQLVEEKITTTEGLYQAIARLKKELRWDDFLENDRKRYRIALNVTGITVNRKKLLENENGRVKAIARKLP